MTDRPGVDPRRGQILDIIQNPDLTIEEAADEIMAIVNTPRPKMNGVLHPEFQKRIRRVSTREAPLMEWFHQRGRPATFRDIIEGMGGDYSIRDHRTYWTKTLWRLEKLGRLRKTKITDVPALGRNGRLKSIWDLPDE
jgi:hypothetical protein